MPAVKVVCRKCGHAGRVVLPSSAWACAGCGLIGRTADDTLETCAGPSVRCKTCRGTGMAPVKVGYELCFDCQGAGSVAG